MLSLERGRLSSSRWTVAAGLSDLDGSHLKLDNAGNLIMINIDVIVSSSLTTQGDGKGETSPQVDDVINTALPHASKAVRIATELGTTRLCIRLN